MSRIIAQCLFLWYSTHRRLGFSKSESISKIPRRQSHTVSHNWALLSIRGTKWEPSNNQTFLLTVFTLKLWQNKGGSKQGMMNSLLERFLASLTPSCRPSLTSLLSWGQDNYIIHSLIFYVFCIFSRYKTFINVSFQKFPCSQLNWPILVE